MGKALHGRVGSDKLSSLDERKVTVSKIMRKKNCEGRIDCLF